MKKIVMLSMLISGTAYGADSWLTCIGKAAGRMALYPVKVIMNKGPRFAMEETPGLYNFATESPTTQTTVTVLGTAALPAGAIALGPVSLVPAAVGVIALDYSYPDDE